MEEAHRRCLQRSRVRLAQELQVDRLWDLLVQRGTFTQDMIEEIQRAGTRRDQARQLVTDLQTRGKQAFSTFIECLRKTGQEDLAAVLNEGHEGPPLHPVDPKPVEIHSRTGQTRPRIKSSEDLLSPVQEVHECSQGAAQDIAASQGRIAETSQRDLEMVYTLKTIPRGYCLIINNVNFSKSSDLDSRTGSDLDCERLERRFSLLHFKVVTRRDLKMQEMVSELQSLAQRDHSSLDCCLVVILSHGYQASHIQFPGGIYGTDGQSIAVERIVSYFNGSHCPTLRGKPKLFFIQACGGRLKDPGCQVDSEPFVAGSHRSTLESDATPFRLLPGDSDEPDAIASLPTPSDILVSYSTFPGFVSWRDTRSGSWYVETLDRVLEDYASSEDLLNMLLRVANAVSAKGKYKQMPGCFNFLRKRFFFIAQ